VITDALPRTTEASTTGAPSSPPTLINVQHHDLLVPGPRPADPCRQLASRSSAWSRSRSRDRQTITTVNRRESINGRDAPREKNPIVTQLVTRGYHNLIAYSLWPGVLLSGWRDLNPRPLRPELRAGWSIEVISAGRRPVTGRCGPVLVGGVAVQLAGRTEVGTGHGPGNGLGVAAGGDGR